jgi:hypothetical protein
MLKLVHTLAVTDLGGNAREQQICVGDIMEVFYVCRDFKKLGKKYSTTHKIKTVRIMNSQIPLSSGLGGQVNSV